MNLLKKIAGSPEVFAIEFQMNPSQKGPLNEWWGNLWLWVESRCIGDIQEKETVSVGLGSLVTAAHRTGLRASRLLSSMPAKEALELVMWAVYGEDDSKLEELVGSRTTLYPFEVLPASDPFFDDWQAILVEEEDTERFIYRKMNQGVSEVKWKLGTFKEVALQAQADFEKIAKLLLADDIVRVVSGEVARMPHLISQAEINHVAEAVPKDQRLLTASAVKRVLTALLHGEITPAQAQSWAAFVMRGYVPEKEGVVQPIDIPYQAECEDAIANAILRLEGLGDAVGGTLDPHELQELIDELSE